MGGTVTTFVVLLSACAIAAQTTHVSFEADLSGNLLAWPHYYEECVGSSHMALGLRADWRAQLTRVRNACGFKRIRGHGLFDNDMDVILTNDGGPVNGSGPPGPSHGDQPTHYSWRNIDSVYDFLRSIGMRPVVALSWLPDELMGASKSYVWHYKGGAGPPANISQFAALVGALADHLVQRHGVDELAQWPFELWNEPNCYPCQSHSISNGTDDGLFPLCPKGNPARNP